MWQAEGGSVSALVSWQCCCVEKGSEAAFRLSSQALRVVRALIGMQATLALGGLTGAERVWFVCFWLGLSVGKSRLLGRGTKWRWGKSPNVLGTDELTISDWY